MIAGRDTKFVSSERYPLTMRRQAHEALRWLLIGGNVAFGLLALVMPKRLGEMLDEPDDAVRRIAQRKLGSALALTVARNRPLMPLAMSAAADARQGAGWLKTKPLLAAVPLIWAALSVAAILTRERDDGAS